MKLLLLKTNSANDLTKFRRKVLKEVKELPIYAEYMHKDAYEISKKYGKDAFLLIYYLGTHTMPFFYKIKSKIEKFLVIQNYSLLTPWIIYYIF